MQLPSSTIRMISSTLKVSTSPVPLKNKAKTDTYSYCVHNCQVDEQCAYIYMYIYASVYVRALQRSAIVFAELAAK
ncbi:hypothetical protein POVWA2_033070 [Plasmodium ovale wallikeri]|uniref:Uncharacterized protein n=1 Tax=Plasmodium ovale wallikeri TaxID=864142 RepID=A0A1A8YZR4_PLAOA|nr:hypothetical protein POVWA1_033450 [Plasmodium ovale wallikeri]SBT37086.1 hypothetical protein POVWA2_033070 [Plasmodium ovale wallikeri]